MEINYNVTGPDRKRLVQAIAEILESDAKYLGVPSCAYQVDAFTISKDGILSFDDSSKGEQLIERLCEMGFEAEIEEVTDGLCIELPLKDTTEAAIDNLRRMVDSKATLIKKALSAASLEIELTDERIHFPWFDRIPEPEVVNATAHLIGKMLAAAKSQKRVTAKEKETDNEKYAFRCFLLRLGFIGEEFKETRRTLLQNLTGSAAFRSGAKKGFSAEYLDAAVVEAEKDLLNGEEAANDEISE
ncbi:virulence protein [Listeria monocytogenes]|uniref:virulence protein n=1 Tax=Listeria monocytogenes TaxID=1639 RepID=UPI000C86A14F|nr:virulence protein [Listeria monocytogenes]EAK8914840.1 virulence protein [Listeria monocytogenes]EHH9781139.1 virulence protein [Listeria monocytogenes]EJL5247966.1 virulence protein [Listeria monocytogenes]EJL5248354.1 virulence protein [Listeria monocytogenes]EJL5268376.1 virulence protein [Listeria monocytogenes]